MHKLWLIFAQTATIVLAALFVVSTLRPELLPWSQRGGAIVTVKEAASDGASRGRSGPGSFAMQLKEPCHRW